MGVEGREGVWQLCRTSGENHMSTKSHPCGLLLATLASGVTAVKLLNLSDSVSSQLVGYSRNDALPYTLRNMCADKMVEGLCRRLSLVSNLWQVPIGCIHSNHSVWDIRSSM